MQARITKIHINLVKALTSLIDLNVKENVNPAHIRKIGTNVDPDGSLLRYLIGPDGHDLDFAVWTRYQSSRPHRIESKETAAPTPTETVAASPTEE